MSPSIIRVFDSHGVLEKTRSIITIDADNIKISDAPFLSSGEGVLGLPRGRFIENGPHANGPLFRQNNFLRNDIAPSELQVEEMRSGASTRPIERRPRSQSLGGERVTRRSLSPPIHQRHRFSERPIRNMSRSPSPRERSPIPNVVAIEERVTIDSVQIPSLGKDMTIHLELDLTEDLELDLEEFSRLSRIGNFREVKKFFWDNLGPFMDNPSVFVQYAQMLMEMGDYKNVKALKVPYSLGEPINQVLRTNWNLIESFSLLHTDGLSKTDKLLVRTSILHPSFLDGEQTLGSTECRMLNLSLRTLASISDVADVPIVSFQWAMMYENMLRQGRIWDFRDIFIGAASYYGQKQICYQLLGIDLESTKIPNKIALDWGTTSYDEPTNLALLDILISLVLEMPPMMGFYEFEDRSQSHPGSLAGAKQYIDKAAEFVSSIMQNHPGVLRSRQYIRWLLAKIAVTDYSTNISPDLEMDTSGVLLTKAKNLDLYIYVAAASETPDWNLFYIPSKSTETLHMVLSVAKELEDYQTQVLCLKQLITHSEDPTEFFDELILLQKSTQNDIEGWLRTCLSKYITCRDAPSRDRLREEILSLEDYEKFDKELIWARHMVLRALGHSKHEANMLLHEAKELLPGLRNNIWNFMKRNKLITVENSEKEPTSPTVVRYKVPDTFTARDERERLRSRSRIRTRGRERARSLSPELMERGSTMIVPRERSAKTPTIDWEKIFSTRDVFNEVPESAPSDIISRESSPTVRRGETSSRTEAESPAKASEGSVI